MNKSQFPQRMPVGLASLYTGVKTPTLNRWRMETHRGKGPAFIKLSPRKVVYDRDDLDRWLEECRIAPVAAK